MKKRSKILCLALAVLLVAALSAPALAAWISHYTPATGDHVILVKYLTMDAAATVPTVTFNYTVAAGTQDLTGTIPVYAGNDNTRVSDASYNPDESSTYSLTMPTGSASFSSSDSKYGTVQTWNNAIGDKNVNVKHADYSLDQIGELNGKYYAKSAIDIDFTGVKFWQPGIYRYTVTEEATGNSSISNDSTARTLDIWVVNNGESGLEIAAYALYDGTTINDDHKTACFTSNYTTYDLIIQNTVTGNQGNKLEYFTYTLDLGPTEYVDGNTATGITYTVDRSQAEQSTDSGPNADSFPDLHPNTSGDTDHDYTFYLKHGQSITVKAIPAGTAYRVQETNGNYSVQVNSTSSPDATTSGSITNADVTLVFTNDRTGVIPTGVLMTIAPFAVVVLIGVAGVAVIIAKKRRVKE